MSKYKRYERYKDSGVEWIGEIPEHWGVIKLKYVTKLAYGDSLPTENREEEGEVDVFGSNGKVGTHNVANTLSPVIIVGRKGSYGKVTYSDKKCFAIDTTYYIDNRCTKSNIKWLYYSLMVLELDKNSQDTGVPGLSREYAYNKYVPVPTVNEQVAIANFLDQKTAEIDGLIADKEKFIELLQEKRQAIITEAVTKGLNPNVRMKDSGIEWIGEIPEHWKVTKLKYIANQIIDGTHSTPQYTDDGIPFLRVTDITNARKNPINLDEVKYISEQEHRELIKRCNPKKGDLLVSKNGTIGIPKVIDWDYEFSIFVSLCLIKVNRKVDVYYCYYYFESNFINIQIAFGGKTNTITNLHLDKIREFIIPLPPIEEQKIIVNYLNDRTDEIDTLINDIRLQIQKLREYRQSLISEAVTGKIDVRDYVVSN